MRRGGPSRWVNEIHRRWLPALEFAALASAVPASRRVDAWSHGTPSAGATSEPYPSWRWYFRSFAATLSQFATDGRAEWTARTIFEGQPLILLEQSAEVARVPRGGLVPAQRLRCEHIVACPVEPCGWGKRGEASCRAGAV